MTSSRPTLSTNLAAAFSIGAGLVHAATAGTHTGDTTLAWLFAVTAVVQGGIGAAILANPSRRGLLAGGIVNLAAAAAWTTSRTVGLPFVAALTEREAVGTQDLAAASFAIGAVIATLVAVRAHEPSDPARRVMWLPVLAVLPALVGVAAPHAHDTSHDHAHGHDDTATAAQAEATDHTGDEHAHDAGGGDATSAVSALAADPVLTGADTTNATEAELIESIELIDATRDALDPAVSDTALTDTSAAEAAGYVWIGDGRRLGGFQHYVNPQSLVDGRVLDPKHIEALVFENTASGPVLVSAMYVLEVGATMADVPDVSGDLTVWHDHQNLCWDATGTRLAGVSTDGKTCRPGGELRATAPMLHVWLDDHDCGPFAGIEGHGSTDCSAHDH